MAKIIFNSIEPSDCAAWGVSMPDDSRLDSPADVVREAERTGIIDDLRKQLGVGSRHDLEDKLRLVRDIAYELAGAKNRDFAVDLFVHVTGIAEFGATSLRDYAAKHGCTHEWFRRQAEEMRKRLDLPLLPSQRDEAIRAEHRLVNRRNDAAA